MKQIIIENVAVPVWETDKQFFIVPDLEPALKYYPQFLKFADLSPVDYLNKVINEFAKSGDERARIWNELSEYLGAEFRDWLKNSNSLYRSNIKTLVK